MNNLPGTDNAVSCDRELLAKGVAIVQRGVSSRSTLPILQGMLIEHRIRAFTLSELISSRT